MFFSKNAAGPRTAIEITLKAVKKTATRYSIRYSALSIGCANALSDLTDLCYSLISFNNDAALEAILTPGRLMSIYIVFDPESPQFPPQQTGILDPILALEEQLR